MEGEELGAAAQPVGRTHEALLVDECLRDGHRSSRRVRPARCRQQLLLEVAHGGESRRRCVFGWLAQGNKAQDHGHGLLLSNAEGKG